jgi:uncharacterized RDD family membrane protein YckC
MEGEAQELDLTAELRTNKRLAIGIGIFGVCAFGALYVAWFLVIFLKPELLFGMLPEQSMTKNVLSDGTRLYLLSERIDMRSARFRDKKPPKVRHFVEVYASGGPAQEVPDYASASAGEKTLVLFSEGGYRTYDGHSWNEVRNEVIGKNPRGVVTPKGIYVVSGIEGRQQLAFIGRGAPAVLPLPSEFSVLSDKESSCSCPCAQLVWYQDHLCLFWSAGKSISWSAWDGAAWSRAATSVFSGGFQVVVYGPKLLFVHRENAGTGSSLSMYVYEHDSWSAPQRLPIDGVLAGWDVFLHQDKPMLFVQQVFSQKLYTIDKGTLTYPVPLKGGFNPFNFSARFLTIPLVGLLLMILTTYGCSVIINKYKNRFAADGERRHEFASLFRRFVAFSVDAVLIMLPAVITLSIFFDGMVGNPFRFVLIVFGLIFYILLGGFLYHSLLEGLLGVTLGKKICGIRVLKADFSPCTLGSGFIRNVLRFVDGFFYYLVAAVAVAGTVKWQRIGDLAATTVVVKDGE